MKLRYRAIILTILINVLFILLGFWDLRKYINFNRYVINSTILSIIFFLGLNWVYDFKVRGFRIFSILFYPSLLIFISTLFIEIVLFSNIKRISAKTFTAIVVIIYSIAVYYLILIINILNISFIQPIPLEKAAKAGNFLYTLSGLYLGFVLIFQSGIFPLIKLLIEFSLVFFIVLAIFSFKKESKKQLLGETLALSLCMLVIFILMIAWPLSSELKSMFSIISLYVLIGLGLEEKEMNSTAIRIEYIFLFLASILLIIKFASWGINGSLI